MTGAADPLGVLAWLWSAIPAAVRDALALSCGLRFAPGRSFPLVLAETTRNEMTRIGLDHDFDVVEWTAAPRPGASEYDPWLTFAGRRWAAGRFAELDRLSAQLTEAADALNLARIAVLCDDLEQVPDADPALLDVLTARHAGAAPKGAAGARLHDEFHCVATARREQLKPERERGERGSDNSSTS